MASYFSSITSTFVSAIVSLIFAPFILSLSLLLFPFAVFTTYFAIVALAIRALLVYIELFVAILRQRLGLEDSYSSWASFKHDIGLRHVENKEQSIQPQQPESLITTTSLSGRSALLIEPRHGAVDALETDGPNDAVTPRPRSLLEHSSAHSSTSSGSSTISQPPSPPSSRSAYRALPSRDYEGVGGWYALEKPSMLQDQPNFQLLETNTRLELPDADPLALTRPKTPDERVSFFGTRSRSNSYTKRGRSSTVDMSSTLGVGERRNSNSSLRARATSSLLHSEAGEMSGIGRSSGSGRPSSMILLGSKGYKVVSDLFSSNVSAATMSTKGIEVSQNEGTAEQGDEARRNKKHAEDGETASLDSAEGALMMRMP